MASHGSMATGSPAKARAEARSLIARGRAAPVPPQVRVLRLPAVEEATVASRMAEARRIAQEHQTKAASGPPPREDMSPAARARARAAAEFGRDHRTSGSTMQQVVAEYGRVDDGASYGPSDRIARFYNPSAQGMTMKNVTKASILARRSAKDSSKAEDDSTGRGSSSPAAVKPSRRKPGRSIQVSPIRGHEAPMGSPTMRMLLATSLPGTAGTDVGQERPPADVPFPTRLDVVTPSPANPARSSRFNRKGYRRRHAGLASLAPVGEGPALGMSPGRGGGPSAVEPPLPPTLHKWNPEAESDSPGTGRLGASGAPMSAAQARVAELRARYQTAMQVADIEAAEIEAKHSPRTLGSLMADSVVAYWAAVDGVSSNDVVVALSAKQLRSILHKMSRIRALAILKDIPVPAGEAARESRLATGKTALQSEVDNFVASIRAEPLEIAPSSDRVRDAVTSPDASDGLRAVQSTRAPKHMALTVDVTAPIGDAIAPGPTSPLSPSLHRAALDGELFSSDVKAGRGWGKGPRHLSMAGLALRRMARDVERHYRRAVKRAMLDYDLRSSNEAHHHGLSLPSVALVRRTERAHHTTFALQHPEEVAIIKHRSVVRAGRALVRNLRVTEPALRKIWALWYEPQRPYCQMSLVRLHDESVQRALPLPVGDFSMLVTRLAQAGVDTMRGRWMNDCIEIMQRFVSDVLGPSAIVTDAAELEKEQQKVDPMIADFKKFFNTLMDSGWGDPSKSAQVSKMIPEKSHDTPLRGARSRTTSRATSMSSSTDSSSDSSSDSGSDSESTVEVVENGTRRRSKAGSRVGARTGAALFESSDDEPTVRAAADASRNDPGLTRVQGVLRAASVVMSIRVRALLYESIDRFVRFFEMYAPEIDPRTMPRRRPAFHIQASVRGGRAARRRRRSIADTGDDAFAAHMRQKRALEANVLYSNDADLGPEVVITGDDVITGKVVFMFAPAWEEVEGTMMKALETLVVETGSLPRIEGDLGLRHAWAEKLGTEDHVGVLSRVTLGEPKIARAKKRLRTIFRANRKQPDKILRKFSKFSSLYAEEVAAAVRFVEDETRNTRHYDEYLERLESFIPDIDATCPDIVPFAFVTFNAASFKAELIKQVRAVQGLLKDRLVALSVAKCMYMNQRFSDMSTRLQASPDSSDELVKLERYAVQAHIETGKLNHSFYGPNGVRDRLLLVYKFAGFLDRGQGVLLRETFTWPSRLDEYQDKCRQILALGRQKMGDALHRRVGDFKEKVQRILSEVDSLRDEAGLFPPKVQALVEKTTTLHSQLTDAIVEAVELNDQQKLLNHPFTDVVPDLNAAMGKLGPYQKLWGMVSEYLIHYKTWYREPLVAVKPQQAERDANFIRLAMLQLEAELPESASEPLAIARRVRSEAERFARKDMQLLQLLAHPGIRERHWIEIEQLVGYPVPHSATSCLHEMVEIGLDSAVNKIKDVCQHAQKEFQLERDLLKMEAEWRDVDLKLRSHKDTGSFVLTGACTDLLQTLLDDHIVKAQTMKASRFAKGLESRLTAWVASLEVIQETLDVWLKVQATWLYLQPIFSSEDINQQMPTEGEKFKSVDAIWRATTSGMTETPRAVLALQKESLLTQFTECVVLLDDIQRGLSVYLEARRKIFPRFYFLSNDEMLEMLAETKDPTRVQPFLKKCFEGINELEFGKDQNITRMVSGCGEQVDLLRLPKSEGGGYVNPTKKGRNLEVWLSQVELVMRRTMASCVDAAVIDYPDTSSAGRMSWAHGRPGQAVLTATAVALTAEIEETLLREGTAGLRRYSERQDKLLKEVIILVRGDLSAVERATLTALVVQDVHGRDVVTNLIKASVQSTTDFQWISQMRYYWQEGGISKATGLPGSVLTRILSATVLYAWEYLGNAERLVVTPLTERCYRALMSAIDMTMGGAPEGPAGTGKTETIKDLAKATAHMCIVFNCSEGLDVRAMSKFFRGLAATGAWVCFDEFNRIELEVLSVVAGQITSLQEAKRSNSTKFTLDGQTNALLPTANVFITMNPGYAGRSELPDNLKALFRPVAMMVPDYALIAEITLYANGYLSARDMARKVVTTYRLCSEQLSSQDHYDYGMRAVKSVLDAAAALKRQSYDKREDILLLSAITDVNAPKFLQDDLPLFDAILRDLFPGVVSEPEPYRYDLEEAARTAAADYELQAEAPFIQKVLQLYDLMLVRHGFMLVGQPMSSKTATMQVLTLALQRLHVKSAGDDRWLPVYSVVMYPKAMTTGELYGSFDKTSHEWTDGVLAAKFRAAATGQLGGSHTRKWIVFDGPVDAQWVENMNTVLDDNKKLCLMSGEIIKMPKTMSMVFETLNLAAASPATVSRCGMVYSEPKVLGWRPLLMSWLEKAMEDNPRFPFRAAKPSEKRETRMSFKMTAAESKRFFVAGASKEEGEAITRDARRRSVTGAVEKPPTEKKSIQFSFADADIQAGGDAPAPAGFAVTPAMSTYDASVPPTPGKRSVKSIDTPKSGVGDMDMEDTRLYTLDHEQGEHIEMLFDSFVEPCLLFLRTEMAESEYMESQDEVLVWTLLSVFDMWLGVVVSNWQDGFYVGEVLLKGRPELTEGDLDNLFVMSLLWSIGATCNADGRRRFSDFLRGIESDASFISLQPFYSHLKERGWVERNSRLKTQLPVTGVLHDHFYSPGEGRWRSWLDALPTDAIPEGTHFNDILVPTVQSTQLSYLVFQLLKNGDRVLVCSPIGSGKTRFINKLLRDLPPETYATSPTLTLTVGTSPSAVKRGLNDHLERRSRNVLGPTPGLKLVVFIDDVNLPEPDHASGAQPPLELLRQVVGNYGWYDYSDNKFCIVQDVGMAAAMAPPGGARNAIPIRLMRHMCQLSFPDSDDTSLRRIYGSILKWFVSGAELATDVGGTRTALLSASLDVYDRVLGQLLPTPAKPHYLWNARDITSVMRGVTLVEPTSLVSPNDLARVWLHEILRVFADRIGDERDKSWFFSMLRAVTLHHFSLPVKNLCRHLVAQHIGDGSGEATEIDDEKLDELLCVSFLEEGKQDYKMVSHFDELVAALDHRLLGYNAVSKTPMDVIMFPFFVAHVSRVARILHTPGRHGLLIGVGGSGRRSAARMAAHVVGMQIEEIEPTATYGKTEWLDDLKKMVLKAGTGTEDVMLLFNDSQLKWEGMLEDLNSVMTIGIIPHMFGQDEVVEIAEAMSSLPGMSTSSQKSKVQLFEHFVSRARRRLHVIFTMTPSGHGMRDRLRRYPSILSECSVDWFSQWPTSALSAVGHRQIASMDLEEHLEQSVVEICILFHQSARMLAEPYLADSGLHVFVTPTSYLELLAQLSNTLNAKRAEVSNALQRYELGLEKLRDAAEQVTVMRADLRALQPSLIQAQQETAELLTQFKDRLETVEGTRRVVSMKRDEADLEARTVAAQKQECEDDLAAAMPALEAAIKALDALTAADITNLKSMVSPPANVRLVMAAVCVMLSEKPDRVPDPQGTGKMMSDYWGPAKRLLGDLRILDRLKAYDKDDIPPKVMVSIRKSYLPNPDFHPEKVRNASSAAEGMCKWIRALSQYDKVAKVVAPKREAVEASQEALVSKSEVLKEMQKELNIVEAELDELRSAYEQANQRKIELEAHAHQTEVKLSRAEQLIGMLGGEQTRWSSEALRLKRAAGLVTGDVLLSAGVIAYLGPFDTVYRRKALEEWVSDCIAKNVPCSVAKDDDTSAPASSRVASPTGKKSVLASPTSMDEFLSGAQSLLSPTPTGGSASGRGDLQPQVFSLAETLGNRAEIQQWHMNGLPMDILSVDNAVIVTHSLRWPLMVDPQYQAVAWIRATHVADNLVIIKPSDEARNRKLERAVQFGHPVLLEDMPEALDPALIPLLARKVFVHAGVPSIQIGDVVVEYNEHFSLYMTTRDAQPHFPPEFSALACLVNFGITPAGLEEQLLGFVTSKERPELQERRVALVSQLASNASELKKCEDDVLEILASAEGNILEDSKAIEALQSAKVVSKEIMERQQIAAKTAVELDVARDTYRSVARHASSLFFTVMELAPLEHMYQYSLEWFQRLFGVGIERGAYRATQGLRAKGKPEAAPDADAVKPTAADDTDLGTDVSDEHKGVEDTTVPVEAGELSEEDSAARKLSIVNTFTLLLYQNVTRSLFEKDKLLFSFLLAIRLKSELVEHSEWVYLLSGNSNIDNEHSSQRPFWLPSGRWADICSLSQLEGFTGLRESFNDGTKTLVAWKRVYESEAPQDAALPSVASELSLFRRIVLMKALRPDKVIHLIRAFVADVMGEQYLRPPQLDLAACFSESTPRTPIVFILSPGSDPVAQLRKFAEEMHTNVHAMSLGKDQGPRAKVLIDVAARAGDWVVLENCHLAASWMPELGKLVADLDQANVHTGFRLCLTSYPVGTFPVAILQSGIKITSEAPKGVRANVLRSYLDDSICDPTTVRRIQHKSEFLRMLFGLCLFHAVVQERRRFGPMGFNVPYEFSDTDLRASVLMLRTIMDDPMYGVADGSDDSRKKRKARKSKRKAKRHDKKGVPLLDDVDTPRSSDGTADESEAGTEVGDAPATQRSVADRLPMQTLQYLVGEINYGGRVTDENDRRLIECLLPRFFDKHVLEADVQLSSSGDWKTAPPEVATHRQYLKFLDSLPWTASCEVFGFHPNAEITKNKGEAAMLLHSLQLCEHHAAREGGKSGDHDSDDEGDNAVTQSANSTTVIDIVDTALDRLHAPLDYDAVRLKYPPTSGDSMGVVIVGEARRFNGLLAHIRHTLEHLRRAVDGKVAMTEDEEGLFADLLYGRLPQAWTRASYLSRKSLAGYLTNLNARCAFVRKWASDGVPPVMWIGGLFAIQTFLTGVLQRHSRKFTIPIDHLVFDFEPQLANWDSYSSEPTEGAYVNGMYLDGARWDPQRKQLAESVPNQLYSKAPVMWIKPCKPADLSTADGFECPLYRVSTRAGNVSTAGQSDNFVMRMKLPSHRPPAHWVQRGTALLLQLDE